MIDAASISIRVADLIYNAMIRREVLNALFFGIHIQAILQRFTQIEAIRMASRAERIAAGRWGKRKIKIVRCCFVISGTKRLHLTISLWLIKLRRGGRLMRYAQNRIQHRASNWTTMITQIAIIAGTRRIRIISQIFINVRTKHEAPIRE